MTVVARVLEHPDAFKGARRRADEVARFHAEPVLYDFPQFGGAPMFVDPDVRQRVEGDEIVVERRP